jgi:hypothetical protein
MGWFVDSQLNFNCMLSFFCFVCQASCPSASAVSSRIPSRPLHPSAVTPSWSPAMRKDWPLAMRHTRARLPSCTCMELGQQRWKRRVDSCHTTFVHSIADSVNFFERLFLFRDLVVPWAGDVLLGFPSVDDNMGAWRARNKCSGSGINTFNFSTFSNQLWTGCADGNTVVELVTNAEGGHT